jgi:hypothetical protein
LADLFVPNDPKPKPAPKTSEKSAYEKPEEVLPTN